MALDLSSTLAGGITALVGKIVFDWLSGGRTNEENGHAGEKSTAWWEQRFREIIEHVMDRRNSTLKEMFRDVLKEELRK